MSFDDLIDFDDLTAEEEARLRRVHDLLVAAGPPPDLSPELAHPPVPADEADPPEVAFLLRRRRGLVAALALAAALAVFGGGYAVGHSKAKPEAFASVRDVPMHGAAGVNGLIRIAAADSVGNWPMLVEVSGLPAQPARRAYYELWLTRNGKPVAPCGTFRVHGKTTAVRLTVPYALRGFDGWAVTAQPSEAHEPGHVVMTT
ncbi:MAG TPA: anti-sigma factor [Gaiellaceae bacterium]